MDDPRASFPAILFTHELLSFMSWCFKDETNKYGDAVLDRLAESTAIVSPSWPLEVVNVLLVAERRNRLKQVDSVRFITLLSQLPIVVEHEGPEKK